MENEKCESIITRRFDDVIIQPLLKSAGRFLAPIPVFILSMALLFVSIYSSIKLINQYAIIPLFLFVLYFIFIRLANKIARDSAQFDLLYHSLNSLANGLFVFVVFQYFDLSQWYLFVLFILLMYALGAFYYYYQFKTNNYPAVLGNSSDLVILIIIVLFVSFYSPVGEFLQKPIIGVYNLIDIALMVLTGIMIFQLIKLVKNVPHVTYGIWLFFTGLLIISVFGYYLFTPFQLAVSVALYGAWYIVKLKVAVLVDGVERSTGLFTPIMVAVSYFMESLSATNTFIIVTAYMLFGAITLLYKGLKSIKLL